MLTAWCRIIEVLVRCADLACVQGTTATAYPFKTVGARKYMKGNGYKP